MTAKPARVPLHEFMPYGAPDLLEAASRTMIRSTVAGSGLVSGLFLCAFGLSAIVAGHEPPPIVVPVPEIQILPPPLEPVVPPQVQVRPWLAPRTAVPAAPIPVPDVQAPPQRPITPGDPVPGAGPGGASRGGGEPAVAPPAVDELPAYGAPVYVDELPEVISRPAPPYPDLAREAGVDGLVVLQALVDKTGRVRDVRVVKSIPMLDDAARAAVMTWLFKPALSNNRPVAVWVAVPVRFTLH